MSTIVIPTVAAICFVSRLSESTPSSAYAKVNKQEKALQKIRKRKEESPNVFNLTIEQVFEERKGEPSTWVGNKTQEIK